MVFYAKPPTAVMAHGIELNYWPQYDVPLQCKVNIEHWSWQFGQITQWINDNDG